MPDHCVLSFLLTHSCPVAHTPPHTPPRKRRHSHTHTVSFPVFICSGGDSPLRSSVTHTQKHLWASLHDFKYSVTPRHTHSPTWNTNNSSLTIYDQPLKRHFLSRDRVKMIGEIESVSFLRGVISMQSLLSSCALDRAPDSEGGAAGVLWFRKESSGTELACCLAEVQIFDKKLQLWALLAGRVSRI